MRLDVNTQKTKYLCTGTETENLILKGDREVETCKEYEYLATKLNREGTDDRKINKRITKV